MGTYKICKYYTFVSPLQQCTDSLQASQDTSALEAHKHLNAQAPVLTLKRLERCTNSLEHTVQGFEESVKPTYIWPVDTASTRGLPHNSLPLTANSFRRSATHYNAS